MTEELELSESKTQEEEKEQEKEFTQEEMKKQLDAQGSRMRKKYEKMYAGIDIEQYSQWKKDAEEREAEEMKKKGEFEKILKSTVEKKDAEIADLLNRIILKEIDEALITSASKLGAIAPDQVSTLLRSQVRLGEDGKAEVVDGNGNARYTDNGDSMKPSDLVSEFLTASPHFVKASGGGTGSTGNAGGSTLKQKSVADMTIEEYREHRQSIGRGTVGKTHIG